MALTFYADSKAPVSSAIFTASNTPGRLADQVATGAQQTVSVGILSGVAKTFGWLTNSGDPGVTQWPAGTYRVVLNQTGNSIYTSFTKVEILQVDSTGTTVKSVVGTLALNQVTSNAVHVWNVPGAATTVDPGDILAVRISVAASVSAAIDYQTGVGAGTYVLTPIGTTSQSIGAAAYIVGKASMVLHAGAAIFVPAAHRSINAAAIIRQHTLRSIGAAARIVSNFGVQSLGASSRIEAQGSTSIGAGAFLVPATATVAIGAASFIVPATVSTYIGAAALVAGIATVALAAGARIRTTPVVQKRQADRFVRVYPEQRTSSVSVVKKIEP